MAKFSQKDLLEEGITGLISKGLKKGAQAVGAVGGALKAVSDAGIDAGLGSAVKGGKAGYEKVEDMLTTKKDKLLKTLDDQGVMLVPGSDIRGAKKLAVVKVVQYDYDADGNKIPLEGDKPQLTKYRYKDGSWDKVTGAREIKDTDTDESKKEEPKEDKEEFTPEVGDEVLVRTKKSPVGEPGVVRRLNPNGRITVATAGNKAGYAFDPRNVLPNPRVRNEKSSQIDLLRQLTLLSD